MPGPVVNNDCFLYYNTNTNASPTWAEIARAKGATVGSSASTVETTARDSKFEFAAVNTVKVGPLSFDYQIIGGTDAVFNALRAAFLAKTPLQFAETDGPIASAGSQGWKAYFQITKCDVSDTDSRTASVEAELCRFYESDALVEPAWMVAS